MAIRLHCRSPRFHSWVGKMPWRRDRLPTPVLLDFPCGSAGEEYACNVGDLGSIPGLVRSPGEGTATHSSILAWRLPHGVAKSQTWLSTSFSILSLSMAILCFTFWRTWTHSSRCIQDEFLRNTKVPISALKAWGWWEALKNKQGPVLPLGNYVTFIKFLNYIWSLHLFVC